MPTTIEGLRVMKLRKMRTMRGYTAMMCSGLTFVLVPAAGSVADPVRTSETPTVCTIFNTQFNQ